MTMDPQVKVHQGKATWVAGLATTDAREVHLFDLATDQDQVVETAHLLHSFFAGNLLVWPESNAPSNPTQLKAYDSASGAMANLPGALNAVQNSISIVGNAKTWAWSNATHKQVWAWRTGWAAPKEIFDGSKYGQVDWIHLAGDIVNWSSDATYAADLRSGSYVKLTPEYGSSMGKGTYLEFMYGTTQVKSQYPSLVSFVVDVSKLPPLSACTPNS